MTAGIQNEFRSQYFPIDSLKNGSSDYYGNLALALITGDKNLAPRKVYFSECHLRVGMTAGIQNEFRAYHFQLESLKNGSSDDRLWKSSFGSYYWGIKVNPREKYIFLNLIST
jgi:hypothetical protein